MGFKLGYIVNKILNTRLFATSNTGKPVRLRSKDTGELEVTDTDVVEKMSSVESKIDRVLLELEDITAPKPEALVGYSNEEKPTDVEIGSSFLELDTKEIHILGSEGWVKV